MKYYFHIAAIFLAIILSSNISLFAQGFSFFPSTIETDWDYKEELIMKVNAKNTSSLNLSISYTVLELTMTPAWYDELFTQFCDVSSCYTLSTFKKGDIKEMNIMANTDKAVMTMDIYPKNIDSAITPGKAFVSFGFQVKGMDKVDTLTFSVNNTSTGVKELTNISNLSITAQNNELITAKVPSRTKSLRLYSLQGQLIKEYTIDNVPYVILGISDLSNGLYSVLAIQNDGSSASTTFIKQN